MKTCPKCNGKYFDIDTHCSECGVELIDNKEYNAILSELQLMTPNEREEHKFEKRYRAIYKYYYNYNNTPNTNQHITKNKDEQNIPKCPTCGSTNVEPISTGRKAIELFALGLASKTVGKTYKCKNCGYHW